MFNLKKAKSPSKNIFPGNKALQNSREDLDNKSDDNPSTHEKLLAEQRKDEQTKTTEAQMDRKAMDAKEKIVEKKFDKRKVGGLYMPSINAFVNDLVKERRKEFTDAQTKEADNWTLSTADQNGALPEYPKITKQHENKVLPNDVNRTKDEPLIGGKIHKASVDNAATAIKNGATKLYDEKIVGILSQAFNSSRDLTTAEKSEINQLKKERTNNYLGEKI